MSGARVIGLFTAAFEKSPLPLWVYSVRSGRILAANPAAQSFYGYSEAELKKMRIVDLIDEPDSEAFSDTIKSLPDRDVKLGRWRQRKKNGTLCLVEMTAVHVSYQRHRHARLVITTDLIGQSNHAFSAISHDLKNPLGAILLSAELLSRELSRRRKALNKVEATEEERERLHKQLDTIRRSARRMKELLQAKPAATPPKTAAR